LPAIQPSSPFSAPSLFLDLLDTLLQLSPSRRLRFPDLLRHPYFSAQEILFPVGYDVPDQDASGPGVIRKCDGKGMEEILKGFAEMKERPDLGTL
jgi:hypothetical protein